MSLGHILIGILVLAAVAAIFIYNGLIRRSNLVKEGWSGIDVQLKRRADLIPNIVNAVKGFMGHESDVLQKVTQFRAGAAKAATPQERLQAESQLSMALGRLMAVAENYPDLKASQNFLELQKTLADTEEQIQYARRYYNGAARNLNISIQSFPNNLIANLFRFQMVPYFELEDPADKNVPKASLS